MNHKITFVIFVIFSVSLASSFENVFGEEKPVEVEIKYTNGDRTDYNGIILKVFQNFDKTPFLEHELKSNPDTIMLPENHRYKIEVYVNGIYGDVGYVEKLVKSERIEIQIPLTGGIKFEIYYKDGKTPIEGATVVIKSNKNTELHHATTSKDGETLRYWIQSTSKQEDYYVADVYVGEILVKSQYPIKIQKGLSKDEKIITNIPEIIEDLITITLYENSLKKIDTSDKTVDIILTNTIDDNPVVDEVNYRGEAHFSNLKPGIYAVAIKSSVPDEERLWPEPQLQIIGSKNQFNIFKINQDENNLEITTEIESCNCIAFRLDDIQDYWLNNVQIQVMKTFVDKKIPITLGIIGDSFGDDIKMVNFINDHNNKRYFEIASHGTGNIPFTEFSIEEQEQKLSQSVQKINEKLDTIPKTFIPPQNRFDENTKQVLIDNGFTHMSASLLHGDSPPFPLKNEKLYRYPEISTTGEFDPKQNIFVGISNEITFSNAIEGINKYGFAVITLHPQEFSVVNNSTYVNKINSDQLLELEKVIEKIQEKEIEIVPINQINLDSQNDVPVWIKNNAGWWADGQIEDATFVQGIEYLVKNGIIKVNEKSQMPSNETNIPVWIKNNAGWWADGQIEDATFVQGIEYLVKNGIITY